jgi:murein DD-endopeptidase MepM/ murein hydrolase activator NlpD
MIYSGSKETENLGLRLSPSRKLRRIRLAWFFIGMLFGAAAVYYAVSYYQATEYYSNRNNLENKLAVSHIELYKISEIAKIEQKDLVKEQSLKIFNSKPEPKLNIVKIVEEKPSAPSMQLPAKLNVSVKQGDTLLSMLVERGIAPEEAKNIITSMGKIYNPKNITVGQSMQLHLDKSKYDMNRASLRELSINVSPLKSINLLRTSDKDVFSVKEIKEPTSNGVGHAGGIITSSLYQTAMNAGLPANMIHEIINALSYDVDFQRDIHDGDELSVVFERTQTNKGATASYGKILYISLILDDKELYLYRHVSKDGYSGYYTNKGESVKKALLKTPINGAQITSGFGMRVHPLMGYSKMHKGVDFGAATGTPIYAAGDGIVDEAGKKGGYGNYVRIKHNNNYSTAYAHASRIAKGVKPGASVRQGQVIAYVGSTGNSTGPHLHYEILANGEQVNPSGVKFRTGQTLAGKELASFKKNVKIVETALATVPRTTKVAFLKK